MSEDFSVPIAIRRSARAKHLRLVVKPAGVELVVPPSMAEDQALELLRHHRAWAERKISELRGRLEERPPATSLLEPGATVPFQGREVPLVIDEAAGRRARARIDYDGRFLIALPAGTPEQSEAWAKTALYAWIKAWLRAEAARLISRHAVRFGLYPRELRIKRMKSRWGSCGPRNDINLNWLLAFAPPTVLEYVIVHELCHIRYRDHSKPFWNLVSAHVPRWAQERQWLKTHGGELLRRFA